MNYLLVDDEPAALKDLEDALKKVCEGQDYIAAFTSSDKALASAGIICYKAAFLDIEMADVDGLTLAKQVKDLQPDIHIIFVTAHEKYAVHAFQIHATGYLLKPVISEDIYRELTFMYPDRPLAGHQIVSIQTFGNFAVFINGKLLQFNRAKTKELLALLVDRKGSALTTREVCAILWEDTPYTCTQKNYFHQILHDLKQTLKKAGADRILVKRRNSISIDPGEIDCDSYRFMAGDPAAVNSYRHNYLNSYSWAEFTAGLFENTE